MTKEEAAAILAKVVAANETSDADYQRDISFQDTIAAIQSAVAEREAAIIKWLREQASDQIASRYHRWSATLIADAIERGDHR